VKLFGLFAFLMVAWFCLSPRPLPTHHVQRILDPFDHLILFGVFSLICFFVWPNKTGFVLGLLLLIAIGMELVQMVLPRRSFEVSDLLTNIAGVSIGGVVYYFIKKKPASDVTE